MRKWLNKLRDMRDKFLMTGPEYQKHRLLKLHAIAHELSKNLEESYIIIELLGGCIRVYHTSYVDIICLLEPNDVFTEITAKFYPDELTSPAAGVMLKIMRTLYPNILFKTDVFSSDAEGNKYRLGKQDITARAPASQDLQGSLRLLN